MTANVNMILMSIGRSLSRSAGHRKSSLRFLAQSDNRDRFSFVIVRADHDFQLAVTVQIQRRDHFCDYDMTATIGVDGKAAIDSKLVEKESY